MNMYTHSPLSYDIFFPEYISMHLLRIRTSFNTMVIEKIINNSVIFFYIHFMSQYSQGILLLFSNQHLFYIQALHFVILCLDLNL